MDQLSADCEVSRVLGAAGANGMTASLALARRPQVESHFADGTLWLRPHARFTFIECAAADAAFLAAGSAVQRVVVALDAVDSVDSSAAGLLLYMLDALGERSVEVRGPRATVDAMLRRMCLDRVLTIRH